MTPNNAAKLRHLEWAVESRARNQRCAVRLLRLFKEHEEQWKTSRWARAAQDLLSVSFSLWRAAFLADKTARRAAVFSDATDFLEKIVEDNAISYPQDRKCREWTFNYYTRNARASLQTLHEYWSENVPAYVGEKRAPTKRWEYCQELLDVAVACFEAAAQDLQAKANTTKHAKDVRLAAKVRRRKSREITLAKRNSMDNG
jgi:hypothetical protein